MKAKNKFIAVALLLLSITSLTSYSQTFTNATAVSIPDSSVDLMIPVTVSGLPNAIDSSFGIALLCFNITHQNDANLRVSLQSPDGSRIVIVDQKGGSGQNFTGTCIAENGPSGWIMNGVPPFNSTYYPQQSLNILNNNQNPNGTWYFVINDLFSIADTGSFHSVSITFSQNPPPNPAGSGPCTVLNAGGCQCPDSTTGTCDLLPDISASPLSIIQDHSEHPGYIRVGVATPNTGWGPLEVHGSQNCFCDTVPVACSTTLVCPNGNPPTQQVSQTIYHKSGSAMTTYNIPAGTMSYHPSHGHIHVDDWVHNSIRVQTSDPDPRNWPIVGAGTKISFCLINLFSCDDHPGFCKDSLGNTLHVADFPNAGFGDVSGCGVDQGIYVGYADEYNSQLTGQEIYIPNACNETYYIVSIIDPYNHFKETNDNNNWTAVPITLTQQAAGTFLAPGFNTAVSGMQVAAISNAANPDSCVWHWGDGTTSVTGVAGTHIYTQPGTYAIQLLAWNHCGPRVSTDSVTIGTTDINSISSINTFEVYPNPAHNTVNFTYELNRNDDVKMEIMDADGRVVKSIENPAQNKGKHEIQLDAAKEGFAKGIYITHISTLSGSAKVKWVLL